MRSSISSTSLPIEDADSTSAKFPKKLSQPHIVDLEPPLVSTKPRRRVVSYQDAEAEETYIIESSKTIYPDNCFKSLKRATGDSDDEQNQKQCFSSPRLKQHATPIKTQTQTQLKKRRQNKKISLTKRKRLEHERWLDHFALLLEYRNQHGTYNAPYNAVISLRESTGCQEVRIGEWLLQQKLRIDRYSLSRDLLINERYKYLTDLCSQGLQLWFDEDNGKQCHRSAVQQGLCDSEGDPERESEDDEVEEGEEEHEARTRFARSSSGSSRGRGTFLSVPTYLDRKRVDDNVRASSSSSYSTATKKTTNTSTVTAHHPYSYSSATASSSSWTPSLAIASAKSKTSTQAVLHKDEDEAQHRPTQHVVQRRRQTVNIATDQATVRDPDVLDAECAVNDEDEDYW